MIEQIQILKIIQDNKILKEKIYSETIMKVLELFLDRFIENKELFNNICDLLLEKMTYF